MCAGSDLVLGEQGTAAPEGGVDALGCTGVRARRAGGSEEQVEEFFALGMLCHLIVSTGADEMDASWTRTLAAGTRHC
ncbi:hypothetical protein ABZ770_23775 [Streptomyces sp. NPDC006654]|uniref:hypothetical protein n=1 Tax=unclassified Streptomyces TaxID=2593676 RepID=UPI0033DA65FE